MEPTRSDIVFVIGAPGAGKGTLCKKLAEDHGFRHLSVGDLLRQVILSPTVDKTIVEYVRRGELLPTEMLFSILKPQIEEPSGRSAILLDGFPRQLDQAGLFEERFGNPRLVLFFDCPEELATERVVHRLAGRDGDNYETFKKRHQEFMELNPPILRYYEGQDKLIMVDTSGDSDASYAKLQEKLRTRSEWDVLTDSV